MNGALGMGAIKMLTIRVKELPSGARRTSWGLCADKCEAHATASVARERRTLRFMMASAAVVLCHKNGKETVTIRLLNENTGEECRRIKGARATLRLRLGLE
jgi:hypothetical protein